MSSTQTSPAMRYLNELTLFCCFLLGSFAAGLPGNVTDYVERAETRAAEQVVNVATTASTPMTETS